MPGRTRRRTPVRLHRILARHWLILVGASLWGLSAGGQAPAPAQSASPGKAAGPTAPPVQSPPAGAGRPAAGDPDADFIEFLGEDDHGDQAWWELLNRTQARGQDPAPTPQAPKQ